MKLKYQEETDLMLNPWSQVLLKGDLFSYVPGSVGQGGQLQVYSQHPLQSRLRLFFIPLQSKSNYLAFHLRIRMASLFDLPA